MILSRPVEIWFREKQVVDPASTAPQTPPQHGFADLPYWSVRGDPCFSVRRDSFLSTRVSISVYCDFSVLCTHECTAQYHEWQVCSMTMFPNAYELFACSSTLTLAPHQEDGGLDPSPKVGLDNRSSRLEFGQGFVSGASNNSRINKCMQCGPKCDNKL